MPDPFGFEIERAPHRSRPRSFSSVCCEVQPLVRSILVDITKKFSCTLAFVAPDAKSNHIASAVANCKFCHGLRGFGSKLAYGIEDPKQ